jgi:uncharacterized membrane protein
MGIALVASLALNVLVVSALATAAWRHRHAAETVGSLTLFGFSRTLPAERRRELYEQVRGELQQLRPLRGDQRRWREEVRTALAAEPFDAARYKQAHEAAVAADMRAREASRRLFEAVVMRLSKEERMALSRWLARAERPWRRRGAGPDADDTPTPAREGTSARP